MLDLEADETRQSLPNGSLLRDFAEDFVSPLDIETEAEADFFKIVESSDFVESTVDFWQDGGKSFSASPACNPEAESETLADAA